jgi:hypothetical protein
VHPLAPRCGRSTVDRKGSFNGSNGTYKMPQPIVTEAQERHRELNVVATCVLKIVSV